MTTLTKLICLIWIALWTVCIGPRAYDNDLRTTIIYQRVVLNYNATHIAATNGIGERAVRRWVERFDLFGTVLADAELFGETRGRPRVITYHDFQNSEIVKR